MWADTGEESALSFVTKITHQPKAHNLHAAYCPEVWKCKIKKLTESVW